MRALIAAVSIATMISTTAARGHEFWIDPEAYFVQPGETITADIRVGEGYEGGALILNPQRLRRFDIASPSGLVPGTGRMGDRPAISAEAPEGLAVLIFATGDNTLTYNEFVKFAAFVEHKAARWTVASHRARGLPQADFVEIYSRYAKSLIAVGDGAGEDRAFGMETEIVALKNPYTDDMTSGMPVEVLYQGAPRAGEQVEIYERSPAGDVAVSTVTTDEAGIATVPVRAGHTYMLDSVVLREPSADVAERTGAVWESLWANITFRVPE